MNELRKFVVMKKQSYTEYYEITAKDKHEALQKFREGDFVQDGTTEGWVGKNTEDVLIKDVEMNLILSRK